MKVTNEVQKRIHRLNLRKIFIGENQLWQFQDEVPRRCDKWEATSRCLCKHTPTDLTDSMLLYGMSDGRLQSC